MTFLRHSVCAALLCGVLYWVFSILKCLQSPNCQRHDVQSLFTPVFRALLQILFTKLNTKTRYRSCIIFATNMWRYPILYYRISPFDNQQVVVRHLLSIVLLTTFSEYTVVLKWVILKWTAIFWVNTVLVFFLN